MVIKFTCTQINVLPDRADVVGQFSVGGKFPAYQVTFSVETEEALKTFKPGKEVDVTFSSSTEEATASS